MAANFVEEIDLNFEEDLGSNGLYSSDVTHLRLNSFHVSGKGKIILANGQSAPVFPALEELQIKTMTGTELNTHEVLGLFAYARKCQRLNKLSFIDCVLPLLLPDKCLSRSLLQIEVSWNPLQPGFRLDSTTGKWILNICEATTLETERQHSLRRLCSSTVYLMGNDNAQSQMTTKLLLQIASRHNIPISHVALFHCSPIANEAGPNLILQFGLSFSILSPLRKLTIIDIDRILTNEELAAILSYSSQCTSLTELQFHSYDMPDTLPVESIPASLNARNVKVWILSTPYRSLNLQTGRWQACDIMGRQPGEEGFDGWSYQESLAMIN